MAKKFRDLRTRMSPASQARAHKKAQSMLAELPLCELRLARNFSQEQRTCTSPLYAALLKRWVELWKFAHISPKVM